MVLGGSSSGKSQYAENIVYSMEKKLGFPVYYLATARVIDEEFAERVKRHRQRRPSTWITVEEQLDLAGILRNPGHKPVIILVDGIGTWLSNLILNSLESEGLWDARMKDRCLRIVQDFIDSWQEIDGIVVMVADEVGWDLTPEYELGRIFMDLNGLANQILGRAARAMYFLTSGIPLCMKGGTPA